MEMDQHNSPRITGIGLEQLPQPYKGAVYLIVLSLLASAGIATLAGEAEGLLPRSFYIVVISSVLALIFGSFAILFVAGSASRWSIRRTGISASASVTDILELKWQHKYGRNGEKTKEMLRYSVLLEGVHPLIHRPYTFQAIFKSVDQIVLGSELHVYVHQTSTDGRYYVEKSLVSGSRKTDRLYGRTYPRTAGAFHLGSHQFLGDTPAQVGDATYVPGEEDLWHPPA